RVLRSQVDDGLRSLVPRVQVIHSTVATPGEMASSPASQKGFSVRVPDPSFGGQGGIAQALAPNGEVVGKAILSAKELRTAKAGVLKDVEVKGNHLRVLATNGPDGDQ